MPLPRLLIFILPALFFGTSCTDSPDIPNNVAPLATGESAPPSPSVPGSPDEPLISPDDLLPEQFGRLSEHWTGDLDGMIERRMIRTLVVSGGPQFFYYNGKPRGLVAELLVLLQAEINQGLDGRLDQVEIVPMPVSRDQLIPALLSGQADLIAADLTVTEARSALVDFSIPLVRDIDEILVFAPGMGEGVDTLDDLSGRSIYVRWSSSYFEHLSALNAELAERGLAPVQVVQANEFLRPQDILEMVNAGLVSATIIDSYKASYWSELLTDNAGPAKIQSLRRQAAAEGRDPNVWIENVELLAARKIGRETVRYVRNIFKYYVAYRLAFETAELRRSARDVQIR